MEDNPETGEHDLNNPVVSECDIKPEHNTSTEWQRTAARRLFQKDLSGAIEAMWQAVTLDPLNFHHWMWLGSLYRQDDDMDGSQRSAKEALRCLDEAPNPTISPEERTRLIVRTSIHAGEPERACEALLSLEALRRTPLLRCVEAQTFEDWYSADLVAAPIFETLLELYGVMADPKRLRAAVQRYSNSLEHALTLGAAEEVEVDELAILTTRMMQAWERVEQSERVCR